MSIEIRNKVNGRVATVRDQLAKALVRIGKHEYANEPDGQKTRKPTRAYRRRDMRVED